MNLRPYQTADVDTIYQAFEAGHQRVLHCLPTGGGKTCEFTEIARLAAASNTDTCIIVHRDNLLQQASAKLRECGVSHSIIAPGRRYYGDRVSVASVQTLVRRLDRYRFDFLIPDEAHHAVSPTYRKIFAAYPTAHVLGVTATPIRTDGQGLGSVFQSMTLGPSIAALIADGYLVEPVYHGAKKLVDLTAVKTRMGDFDQSQLASAMDRREITGDAVENYSKLCPGAPAVVFCVNIKHAEDVANDFASAGWRSAVIHGKMPLATIRAILADFAAGLIQVITSCDLISEGFDVPMLAAVILLRPTKSTAVYLQQVGRALRPIYPTGATLNSAAERLAAIAASSKPHALVLDHAGNCFRPGLGFADDEREWTLEGRKKRGAATGEAAIALRQCPKCYRIHRPAPVCPECGHVYVVETAAPETVDGELVAINKEDLRRQKARRIASARTYNDLKSVAKEYGFSSQWAWRLYCERGGINA